MAWLMKHPEVVYTEIEDGAVLSDADMQTVVVRFVEALEREGLVVAGVEGAHTATGLEPPVARAAAQQNGRRPFAPILLKHDAPLHELSQHPFDPQRPLAA